MGRKVATRDAPRSPGPAADEQQGARVPAGSRLARLGIARPGRGGGARRLVTRTPVWPAIALLYLALGVALWWHVWTGSPSSDMTCACGDPASFVWFLAWPKYALTHGGSLFFSARVHVPGGINLLNNTSVLALGVTLLPVTWAFGPVATLNVALTLAPVLSALAAYAVMRRALRLGRLAAFTCGLLFGFSPFVIRNEAVAHLQVSFMALLPLIFWCTYALTVTQRGAWWRWGAGLGVLVAVQFFIGSELLTITVMMMGLGLLAAAVTAAFRGTLTARLSFAWRGFAVAVAVALVLLAYPLWFALRGPQQIHGSLWASPAANGLVRMFLPTGQSMVQHAYLPMIGYLGNAGTLSGYLGIAAFAVLLLAAVLTRRPLVLLATGMSLAALWFSLGASNLPLANGGEPPWLPLPWRLLSSLPIVGKITPANFSAVIVWFVALGSAILIDHLLGRRAAAGGAGLGAMLTHPVTRRVGAAAVTAALVVPWLFAWPVPLRTMQIATPAWITRTAAHLPGDAVVLFYPFPSSYEDQALVWQAEQGMTYRVVGGRGIVADRAGAADHGFTPGTAEGTMSALTTSYAPHAAMKEPPMPDQRHISSFRAALHRWGVTNVVITPGGRNPAYARRWLTAALGRQPHSEAGVWVWDNVQRWLS